MIELTDPEVLKRSENEAELRRLFPRALEAGGVHVEEQIRGISPEFSDSTGMHYFVSTTRRTKQRDGSGMAIDNYYIVTSRDLGKSWTIVDLACVDERWIKGVAPGWSGYPPAPLQSVHQYNATSKLQHAPPN